MTTPKATSQKLKNLEDNPRLSKREKNALIDEVSTRSAIWNSTYEEYKKTSKINWIFADIADNLDFYLKILSALETSEFALLFI